jgi:hypothetical protein
MARGLGKAGGERGMSPKTWDAGYADGLAGRPHDTDPLHQVDRVAYSAGYIEGQAAGRKGWIPDEPRDAAGNPLPGPIHDV